MTPAAIQEALPEASEVDRAVQAALSHPAFTRAELPAPLRWLVDRYTEAREALWRMLFELEAFREAAPVLGLLVEIALVVALLALLAYLGRGAVRAWRSRNRRQPPETEAERPPPRADTAGAETWEARAAERADAGRWREAALALYRAVVLRLDERGVVSYEASKTPGDYRREATGGAAPAEALDVFLRRFEPIAFGERGPSPGTYGALTAAARDAGARV